MSDHASSPFDPEPRGAAHDAVRDALPALLHGRVTASTRADLDAHLDTCAPCDAELAMLARIRDTYVATAPAISVDRIAAAVRAATIPQAVPVDDGRNGAVPRVAPAHPEPVLVAPARPIAPRPRATPAWARRGALRAFAATLLVAVGSGALYVRQRPGLTPARDSVALAVASTTPSPTAASGGTATGASAEPASTVDPSLLGAAFSDLNETELAAVVAAVRDPAATAPAAEPASMTPEGMSPDGE